MIKITLLMLGLKDSSIFAQGIPDLLLSNATNISTSLSPTPTLDNPVSSPTSSPDASLSFTNDTAFFNHGTATSCLNTLDTVNSSFTKCDVAMVLCSSDPQVAANCCKCKPDCCDQCTSRNSVWDSDYPVVCPWDAEPTGSALMWAVSVLLCCIFILMMNFRQHQHERQTRIQPHNPELPKEKLQARAEQIPSKLHIHMIQTMDCIRSLIEHKESSKTALDGGKNESVIEDVSLDDDANTNKSSNTASSDIDVEQGRQPSPILLLSFWRKQDVENAECPICLEIYRLGDTICISKVAECDHIFHQACVSEWLSKHDGCPLCRIDLMSETR
jgi:hypothetical protein